MRGERRRWVYLSLLKLMIRSNPSAPTMAIWMPSGENASAAVRWSVSVILSSLTQTYKICLSDWHASERWGCTCSAYVALMHEIYHEHVWAIEVRFCGGCLLFLCPQLWSRWNKYEIFSIFINNKDGSIIECCDKQILRSRYPFHNGNTRRI